MLLLLDEHTGALIARAARPSDQLRARLGAHHLDADLARGAAPEASAPLALRAQQLTRPAYRRGLARSARRILAESARPSARGHPALPVCRDRVQAAAGELAAVIDRLLAPGPVPAQGVAQVAVLLSDGGSPLYRRGSADDLRARLAAAAGALTQPSCWPSG
jgi:hypothetical protein